MCRRRRSTLAARRSASSRVFAQMTNTQSSDWAFGSRSEGRYRSREARAPGSPPHTLVKHGDAKAGLSGGRAAVLGRAEQPHLGRSVARGLRLDFGVRVVGGQRAVEETDQVLHLLRQGLRARALRVRK